MNLAENEDLLAQKYRLILLQGDAQLGLVAHRIEDVVTVRVEDLRESTDRKKKSRKTFWSANSYIENKQRMIPILNVESLADV